MKNKKIMWIPVILIFVLVLYGCNNNKNNFGPYGSTHMHADFKVYILGNPLNFDVAKYQVMEDLTHVENNDGDVLHVHATGITLGYFFESLGFKLTRDCLKLDAGNEYCNTGNAQLKVYLKAENGNWEQLYYPADYVIQDLDKILVTYGTETDEEIKKQMESVTDKAKVT